MNKRIVLTRPGGFVSIVYPSRNAIKWMGCGGRWPQAPRGFLDAQYERHVAAGHRRETIWRYLHAMMFGGCTTAEGLSIIRDRDCAHRGTGIELWDVGDMPSDRWFRDAWRRAPNGGPIWIDLDVARTIQERRVATAIDNWNAAERRDPSRWGHNGPAFIELDWRWLKRATARARSVEELKAVWHADLPRCA